MYFLLIELMNYTENKAWQLKGDDMWTSDFCIVCINTA